MSNSKPTAFEQGAQWIRADFHLHTRADREFRYTGDDSYYNSDYVSALEKARIRLGVITNHNKFDYAEFRALRKTARKKNIALLPGVELSVNDGANGIHTLIVFSDDWLTDGHDHINPFLSVMFAGKTPEQYEHENGRSSFNLEDTIKKLEDYQRDFFLVFAHVEAPNGLWSALDGGRLTELGENPFFRRHTLGFQKVRTYDKHQEKDKPCRTKIRQYLKDWYPAELEGSDPKCIEEIGQGKTCYLRIGELSFRAVRFALTDHASRVAQQPPEHRASHIRSIHFDGGILDGQMLHFAPELNTLIGIRGSGKSSILEAIGYVLDIPRGDRAQDTQYKQALIRHTLGSGGKITLKAYDAYGQAFTISRIYGEVPDVYLHDQRQPGVSIRETILRHPIYFGQKDLSSIGEGFEADLVEKLVGEQLSALRQDIARQRQVVREAARRWLKLSDVAEQQRDYAQQLSDAEFRLKKFAEYGIADRLQKRLGFQQDTAALARLSEQADHFIAALDSLIAEHEDELRNAMHYKSAQNPAFFTECYTDFRQLIEQVEQLRKIGRDAGTVAGRLKARQDQFADQCKRLQEEFAQIERQLARELKTGMAPVEPDDFLHQQQRKTKAEHMLEALQRETSQQATIRAALFTAIDQLNTLWLGEFDIIKAALDRVNASHEALQIEAGFRGDKAAAINYMKQLFKGSHIRETTLQAVMTDYADFGELLRDLPAALERAGSAPEVFRKTFMQNLAELLTWQVPNRFVIRYRGKALQHHSLGQRASALMMYILSQQKNDVIIIDQPEDDLDNQTIYDDVIRLMRQLKPSTQFILATHNANFPVLGDAEQVHACQFRDERITVVSGSIDAHPIQEAVINIMEGGREAFNRRTEVYNQWKPQN